MDKERHSSKASSQESINYADAGVDIVEGARAVEKIKAAVQSTYRDEVVGDLGGFGGLFSLKCAQTMKDPLLVSGTDGVGTKLELAKRTGLLDGVGIDLVAMCANDILACGAEPLFFLDYIAIGKLNSDFVASIVQSIAEGCKQAGCSLIGGEMAEHPGVMAKDDFDLSGFCTGIVERESMLDPSAVQVGDILLALPSSGFHSNGYSLIRAALSDALSDEELHEPRTKLGGKSYAQALLEPTRIYVRTILHLIDTFPGALRALAHITGGGITENLNRALPSNLDAEVKLGSWNVPAIMQDVIDAAHLSTEEALRTFNMGVGMVLIVDPSKLEGLLQELDALGEAYALIGSVIEGTGCVHYSDK